MARITPPERSFPVPTDAEQERILGVRDKGTYEDTRNRAMMAVYLGICRPAQVNG